MIELPCGIPVNERPKRDPRYMLVCVVCGREINGSMHRGFIDQACLRFRCKPQNLIFSCEDCLEMSRETLVNPLNFGRA